jgi:hypothetical protein
MSTSPAIRDLLSRASYATGSTRILTPFRDIFGQLSSESRVFFHCLLPDLDVAGEVPEYAFLVPWNERARGRFVGMPLESQIEVLGFLSALTHEWTHHLDLLATPFGANYHSKLAREYIYFQRMLPVLQDHGPELLDLPLVDRFADLAFGREAYLESGPEGRAWRDLGGVALFDEFMRGAPPRRVELGWPGPGSMTISIGDLSYEKVTVNQVWCTVKSHNLAGYLGAHEILEGRALAMNLLLVWDRLGEDASDDEVRRTFQEYIHTYYENAPRYLTAIEMVAGRPAKELMDSGDLSEIYRAITSTMMAGWYAVHSPPPQSGADIIGSLTTRFLVAARAFAQHDWWNVKGGVIGLLEAIDKSYPELFPRTANEAMLQSCDAVQFAREILVNECSDIEMRTWYCKVLDAISSTLLARSGAGYNSPWGMTLEGNVLGPADDALDAGVLQLDNPPPKVEEWIELRAWVLFRHGQGAEKLESLSDWFGP